MIKLFVRYAPTVLLAVLCIVVFGSMSYVQLPRESAPDVKIPVVLISTPYIGVAPKDIESIVTIPMENELAGVKDIKKMSSTSAEGASIISLEFEPDVVIEDALQRVRDRVNRVKPTLPDDIEEPSIREISLSDLPILLVTIAGPVDQQALKEHGESLADEIKRLPGVLDSKLSGGRTRQIRVQFDPRRVSLYGFSYNDIINAIRNENVNIPGGEVTAGDASFLVRVPGEFDVIDQIEGVAVKRKEGAPIFVRDLARVVDTFADAETYARMNGQPAVSIAVTKRSGANIIEIADAVRALSVEHAETWPAGVEYRILADQSTQIRDMVSDLQNNILTALILVVGVVFFFMGARNSLFVALAIPLSMLMSFIVIQVFGMTLNMIVLFSLILALGMLVDNAIVVVENVYRHMEEGKTLFDASVDGTREVALAVAASTATTVAAFFPMVFWEGIMGQFMGYLPKTVIIVLVSSLVVAVAILPVATSRLMKRTEGPPPEGPAPDELEPDGALMQRYKALLELSIRWKYTSAAIGVGTLLLSFVAYGALNHGTEFFPDTEPNRATIAVRMPDGTDLEKTDRVVRQIEAVLAGEDNIDVFVAETGVAGGGSPLAGAGGSANANQARISVDFLPDRNSAKEGQTPRVESTRLTIDRLRNTLVQIPGAEITIEKENLGPPVGPPIAVEVSGEDFHTVGELAAQVRREMLKIPGAADLKDDYRVNRPELRLRIDRGAAKRIGASTAEVANAVRTAVSGTKASTLRDGKDEHDIIVEVDPAQADDVQGILNLRIPGREDTNPDTFSVPLSAVASYELAGGSGSLRHVDQELVVTIEGNIAEGYNENAVREGVIALLGQMEADGRVPQGYDLRLGGANDEQRDATAFLGRAFLIAVFLIAVVLVTQFNSFTLPGIILASVVLSLVGVLWGLIITGTPFGVIMTGIGVISLAGVVVNNAIVLLDYVEQLRERGFGVHEALVKAGMTRFRPVMLTAITTVLGLVPMAIGVSFDFTNLKLLVGGQNAEFWGPMAIAVIFGLIFATVLTLVMVPTMYSIIEDLKDRFGGLLGRRAAAATVTVTGAVLLAVLPRVGLAAPLSLEDALAAAERNNIQVAIAAEQTIQDRTLRLQAISTLTPSLSGSLSYNYSQLEDQYFNLDVDLSGLPEQQQEALAGLFDSTAGDPIQLQEYWNGSVTLSQNIFNARAFPAWFAANRLIAAAEQDEQWTRTQLRGAVASSFYQLALLRESLPLAERAVAIAEKQQVLAERRVSSGAATQRDLLEVSLDVTKAQRDLRNTQRDIVEAARSFAMATGLESDLELSLPPPVEAPADTAEVLRVIDSRADVRASEEQVEAARLTRLAQDLDWLPTVTGNFTYLYNQNTGLIDQEVYWVMGLTANWRLWDGGYRIALQQRDASRQRTAMLLADLTRQEAEQELLTAWESLQQSEDALLIAEKQVSLAEQNLRLAEANEAAGGLSSLEADNARLLHLQAEIGRLQEQIIRDISAVQLRVAMGDF